MLLHFGNQKEKPTRNSVFWDLWNLCWLIIGFCFLVVGCWFLFVCLFVCLFVRSFVCSFVRSFVRSFGWLAVVAACDVHSCDVPLESNYTVGNEKVEPYTSPIPYHSSKRP